jgi:hypothetical protein
MQAALDAPFERWMVFLHPAQRAIVERAPPERGRPLSLCTARRFLPALTPARGFC